jgi:hypothetical protein
VVSLDPRAFPPAKLLSHENLSGFELPCSDPLVSAAFVLEVASFFKTGKGLVRFTTAEPAERLPAVKC